jgi:hypothetical protein
VLFESLFAMNKEPHPQYELNLATCRRGVEEQGAWPSHLVLARCCRLNCCATCCFCSMILRCSNLAFLSNLPQIQSLPSFPESVIVLEWNFELSTTSMTITPCASLDQMHQPIASPLAIHCSCCLCIGLYYLSSHGYITSSLRW